jgi:hypothetical protein
MLLAANAANKPATCAAAMLVKYGRCFNTSIGTAAAAATADGDAAPSVMLLLLPSTLLLVLLPLLLLLAPDGTPAAS